MNKLGIIIFIVSVITIIFVIRKIRKTHFMIGDSLYWLAFCLLLMVLCLFPGLTATVSHLLGFEAPSNFIFMCIIFLLLIKIFLMDVKLSKLKTKFEKLAQKYSVDTAVFKEKKENEHED